MSCDVQFRLGDIEFVFRDSEVGEIADPSGSAVDWSSCLERDIYP